MKSSNIGGQAVLEGVMMRNRGKYAVAVRKPDGEIEVDVQEYKSIVKKWKWLTATPFIRGVFNFVDSLVLGMKTLMYSASFFEEEEEDTQKVQDTKTACGGKATARTDSLTAEEIRKQEKKDNLLMGMTVAFSIVLAVLLFMVLPYGLSSLLRKLGLSKMMFAVCEGVIRLAIFFLYIVLISKMKDIKRVFMYHGAEHKCINCIEQGLELNVENVRKSSKQHKRCGTSFLLFVIVVSIIVHFFIQFDSAIVNLAVRIALLPVIAGISYELIRLAGSSESPVVNALSKPGLMLQKLTTKEPDDDMIEVGIRSVEAVFDWKAFQEETISGR